MKFYKMFKNFIDVQQYYSTVFNIGWSIGLANMVKDLLGQNMCKGEQLSNWELRPLRKSQSHYAALDAYILIKLLFVLAEKAQKKADPRLKLQESIYELSDEYMAKRKAEELVEIKEAKRA